MTGCTAGPYRVTPTAQQHRAFPDGTLADRSGTGHRRAGAFDVGSRQAPSGFVSISLFDETADGRRLKLCNIVGEYTRQAVAMRVART